MPVGMLPPHAAVMIAGSRAEGFGSAPTVRLQEPQVPIKIPNSDVSVEVVATLPMQGQIQDVSRLLGQRRATANGNNRVYAPTILELIMLVKRNPEKPRGRNWDSISSVNMGYDGAQKLVTVNYCVDYCEHDLQTGSMHRKRRTVSYSAPEALVTARVNKKLADLTKTAR